MTDSMICVANLASYASHPEASRGRTYAEESDPKRNPYQRDRDRIIHCHSFRRLEYKTQVFVNHEGDLFRTRLTHSLEVAQIGRALARNLLINEDLVEAICLAHDLGHTPFGHAGQDALNDYMREHLPEEVGGFEHNLQSLRMVDELEERYADFNGLNLTFETRSGILKHCSLKNARDLGEVGQRFLDRTQPSLEAQLANLADEIAYNNHDIDDGLRSGLINLDQLSRVEIFSQHHADVKQKYPTLGGKRLISETIRRMINTLITNVTEYTLSQINEHRVKTPEDVANAPVLVAFSPEMRGLQDELKQFLLQNLYRHYKVMRMAVKSRRVIHELFDAFLDEPRLLPPDHRFKDANRQARGIADYIAGMTDRYAIKEHRRIYKI
ncbi:Deoxyguanosinetriphosphate triphosphohydrolase [Oligella ureolytica]|uniref:Deoxyguanosinetriphosphate triphosphohydrolase-like protein n=1 Tax=Oligella ureolytica TaxID=90244 RepID=A0A378XH35_9BURK|nr:deoxyguanosinetriphosphate triphosphohydrolase [Oligella ureolytica]QPT39229.1 deoxyguanosinetriphosphate triphosphohydrolase [Oligella ureolytica]SUA55350.1 Deoxyguanosinetriphosphate triphosphohydrolase [Oligella ureolytica]SUA56557.1 Deoxyguanosinetriphosphate triphosphohydrolase [Oligella ureolytica]